MDRKALAAAFPVTVPVLMGYLAIGIAFGLIDRKSTRLNSSHWW